MTEGTFDPALARREQERKQRRAAKAREKKLLNKINELEAQNATSPEAPEVEEAKEQPTREVVSFPNGAAYEEIGQCFSCGAKVFQCTTDPLRADDFIGNRLAVYIVGSNKEKPTVSCQEHDETRKLRFQGYPKQTVDGLNLYPLPMEAYKPPNQEF